MSTSIEAQGHTVDEAIQIALNQLGVSRDKVEIDILHHPRRGVLGIGARRAKVRATIRQAVMPDGEEFDMSGGAGLDDKPRRRRRRGGRNRGRGEEGGEQTAPRPAAGSPRPEERRADQERRGDPQGQRGGREGQQQRGEGGRGRDDRRGGRGRDQRQEGQRGREQGQQRGQQNPGRDQRQRTDGQRADGPREGEQRGRDQQRGERREGRDQQGRGQQQGRRDRDDRRERGPRPEQAAPAEPEAIGQPAFEGQPRSFEGAEATPPPTTHADFAETPAPAPRRERERVEETPLDAEALDAIRARAEVLVRELLEKMGFPAEVSSSIDEAAGEAVVSVRSESEGLLIGRRGQTLDSLEHIVNRMTLKADAYVEGRVLLDIGDYRKRRRESLDELATRLRTRAVTERRTVQVSPMSPRDRKFFAQVFAGDDAVEVRALGAGFYRRVIVAPAGAPPGAIAEADSAGDVEDESLENDSFAGSEAES